LPSRAPAWPGWLVLVLALGLAFSLLVIVPGLFGVDTLTVGLFQPGLGLLLFATSATAIAWAGLHLGARYIPLVPGKGDGGN